MFLVVIILGALFLRWPNHDDPKPKKPATTFSESALRQFITEQTECHAEFFYTHPASTGVTIDDAVDACSPWHQPMLRKDPA